MVTIERIEDFRNFFHTRRQGEKVGIVPTMGNLHKGHLALVEAARKNCTSVVTTIFVNPIQFGEGEDYADYPRTFEKDQMKLNGLEVDVLFAPSVDEIYPGGPDHQTTITVPVLSSILCGSNRPIHFDGVATVVAKLFNIVQPDVAYFGEKDWQQLILIRTMVQQLSMPIDIIGVPTVRENDGLALSSRNLYLSGRERPIAPILHQTLQELQGEVSKRVKTFSALEGDAMRRLRKAGFEPDYVAILDASTLLSPSKFTQSLRSLVAARLGQTRLIDNISAKI